MTQAQNNFSTVYRDYWEDNRLKSDRQALAGGIDKTVSNHYDAAGENIRMHVDDGNGYDFSFTFDSMGRFSQINNTADSSTWFQYYYDASSNENAAAMLPQWR